MKRVIVSNRVPSPGDPPTGGLAVTLLDALAGGSGLWFGWNGGAPAARSAPHVQHHDGIDFVTVPLSEADYDGYYRGFANGVLWPLFHGRLDAVDHDREDREAYDDVNRYFAERLAPRLDDDDVVWVQDYHLIPLGTELRRRGFDGRLGFFLHTPFPPFEVLRALPGWTSLFDGFRAYDLVGFQTDHDTDHFADSVRRRPGVAVDERDDRVTWGGREVGFGTFPVGIDVDETARVARENVATPDARGLLEFAGDRKLVVGADRLDYTKGLVRRVQAFERLLENAARDGHGGLDPVCVQVAAPSRTGVEEYRELAERLQREAGRINAEHNRPDFNPIRLIGRSLPRSTVLGFFALADVGLVTPVRDGMNLVAKEFLASQPPDDPGVLVLSTLAGAAVELGDAAVLVNPYDIDGVAEGLRTALAMPLEERRSRWEAGVETLRRTTARDWWNRFLGRLEDLRPDGDSGGGAGPTRAV